MSFSKPIKIALSERVNNGISSVGKKENNRNAGKALLVNHSHELSRGWPDRDDPIRSAIMVFANVKSAKNPCWAAASVNSMVSKYSNRTQVGRGNRAAEFDPIHW